MVLPVAYAADSKKRSRRILEVVTSITELKNIDDELWVDLWLVTRGSIY